VNKDVVLVESAGVVTPCKGESTTSRFPAGDEAWAEEEAKWYVNPMVESSHAFYDISTPERTNSMFSVCNPAAHGSFEWTLLRSSFATRDTNPPATSPAPLQVRTCSLPSPNLTQVLYNS
jgi:hypothetical protein